jgi:hypothetical protein
VVTQVLARQVKDMVVAKVLMQAVLEQVEVEVVLAELEEMELHKLVELEVPGHQLVLQEHYLIMLGAAVGQLVILADLGEVGVEGKVQAVLQTTLMLQMELLVPAVVAEVQWLYQAEAAEAAEAALFF